MVADPHLAVEGEHGPPRIEPALRQREIGVGEDHAEQQQRVGLLHQPGDDGVTGGAEICAEQDVRSVLEQPASHEGRDDRNPELARQCRHPLLEIVPADLHVDEDHGGPGVRQFFDDLLGAFGERVGISRAQWQHRDGRGRRRRHVARQLDIDRQ